MIFFSLQFVICLLIPLNIFCSESQLKIDPEDNPNPEVAYHLKWITNQTLYPIKFSIPIKQHLLNDSSVWDWIRTSDQNYVSKLPDILERYLVTETESRASMYILNYDNATHDQLSSYEPRFVTDEPNFRQKERDIFTLAYLKKHYIKAHKTDESIKVSCVADFLIPNADHEYSNVILRMMEKQASFKLAVKSANFPNRPNFFRKQQVNPSINRKQNKQQKPNFDQIRPELTQNQPIFNPIANDHQQMNRVFQNPPVFYQPNHQYLENHQFEQNQFLQQNMPPHHEPFDPLHSFPIYNHVNQYHHNDLLDDYHLFDTLHQYDGLVENYRSGVGYPQFAFELPPVYPYSRFEYNDRLYRFKRESEKQSDKAESSEEDFDYDPIKFSKVRLSLGPVIINKPFEKEEIVSCLLNLINYDDVNLVYNSRIIKKIKTSDDKQVKKEENPNSKVKIQKESFEKEMNEKKEIEAKDLEKLEPIESINESIEKERQATRTNIKQSSTLPNHQMNKKPHTKMMFFTDRTTFDHNLAKFEHYYSSGSMNRISWLITASIYFIIANVVN